MIFLTSTQAILNFSGIGNYTSPAILFSIIPVGLVVQFITFGRVKVHHVNHQFSLLYRKSRQISSSNVDHLANEPPPQNAKMEVHAYFRHNFGLTSSAGSAIIALPSEPGTYDISVLTFKPLACSGMNERKCRMHSYYLGTCLSETKTSHPFPAKLSNEDIIMDTGTNNTRLLFSKAGLITDGSGMIRIRVNVMPNYFNDSWNEDEVNAKESVKLRETVDEVLSRVRRNKRIRMSRMMTSSFSVISRGHRRHYNSENEEDTKQPDRTVDNLRKC